MVNLVSPLRAFFQSSLWQERVRAKPVLGTIQEIAELPGTYPYRRVDGQITELLPLLQEAYTGKAEVRNALQQAQAAADRLLSAP